MKESILKSKSYSFAIQIIELTKKLTSEKREFILTRQLTKSGTAIGALIREAEFGQSKRDFINKMNISLKEANETIYWLNLLKDTDYIDNEHFKELDLICNELIAMLVSTIKTSKKNLDN
jgi:four helix bundle protein